MLSRTGILIRRARCCRSKQLCNAFIRMIDKRSRKSSREQRANGRSSRSITGTVLPDGEFRDIHQVGHPVSSPSGDLVEFVGTVMDVTERKQAEDKIREQEAELRQIARPRTSTYCGIRA